MPSAFGDITGHRHQCQQNASGREAPKQNDGKTFFTTRPRDWQGRNTLYFLWWAKSPCGISMKEPRETLITFPFQFRTVQKPVQLKVVTFSFFPLPPSILGQWSLQFTIPQRCSTTPFCQPGQSVRVRVVKVEGARPSLWTSNGLGGDHFRWEILAGHLPPWNAADVAGPQLWTKDWPAYQSIPVKQDFHTFPISRKIGNSSNICVAKFSHWYWWDIQLYGIQVSHSQESEFLQIQIYIFVYTSSTAQGGGGSFKNRKPIGELGCCEWGMAERSHWWTERCLRSPLFLWLSTYLPAYLLCIYLSIDLSISLFLSFI